MDARKDTIKTLGPHHNESSLMESCKPLPPSHNLQQSPLLMGLEEYILHPLIDFLPRRLLLPRTTLYLVNLIMPASECISWIAEVILIVLFPLSGLPPGAHVSYFAIKRYKALPLEFPDTHSKALKAQVWQEIKDK